MSSKDKDELHSIAEYSCNLFAKRLLTDVTWSPQLVCSLKVLSEGLDPPSDLYDIYQLITVCFQIRYSLFCEDSDQIRNFFIISQLCTQLTDIKIMDVNNLMKILRDYGNCNNGKPGKGKQSMLGVRKLRRSLQAEIKSVQSKVQEYCAAKTLFNDCASENLQRKISGCELEKTKQNKYSVMSSSEENEEKVNVVDNNPHDSAPTPIPGPSKGPSKCPSKCPSSIPSKSPSKSPSKGPSIPNVTKLPLSSEEELSSDWEDKRKQHRTFRPIGRRMLKEAIKSESSDEETNFSTGPYPIYDFGCTIPRKARKMVTKWTTEEEIALIEGVIRYKPGQWQRIIRNYPVLASRSNVDVKDKYRNLMKKGKSIDELLRERKALQM